MLQDQEGKEKYLKSLKINEIDLEKISKDLKSMVELETLYNASIRFISIGQQTQFERNMAFMQDINTWLNNINSLIWSINISLNQAIEKIANNSKLFIPFRITNEDRISYYYLENAIIRLVSLWDSLAQLYNCFFRIQVPIHKITYSKFFQPNEKERDRIKNKIGDKNATFLFQLTSKIRHYITETDDTSTKPWLGDHEYIKNIRNFFTHKTTPNDWSILNSSEMNRMPDAPLYELERIFNDYSRLYCYITEIHDMMSYTFLKAGLSVFKDE